MTQLPHVHDNLGVNSHLRVKMLISVVLITSIHIRAQVANNQPTWHIDVAFYLHGYQ